MKTQKAIIYTRVSTGRQAEEGTSLETQEAACLQKARAMNAQVIDIIADEGVSGGLYYSRPGIQKALAAIEAGEANLLITMKLDRSGRDVDALRLIRKRVTEAGGDLIFADGMNFENNAIGNLMFTQIAGYAEYEKEIIRERTMSGRRRRAEEGQQPSRAVSPYGYHVVNKADVLRGEYPAEQLGTYQTVEEQARWAREIFQRYASGYSLRKVCRWLQTNNVPTPQGGSVWLPATIKLILMNPVYKGTPMWGKKQRKTDESRLQRGMIRPDYIVRAAIEKQVALSAPALTDEATWNACQEHLSQNQSTLSGNPARRFMLSGLLRCPVCGRSMSGELSKGYRYYNCTASRTLRSISGQRCTRHMIRADEPETILLRDLVLLSRCPEQFASVLRTFHRKRQEVLNHRPDEANTLQMALKQLDAQEQATARAQVDALMQGRSAEVYDRLLTEIDGKRKAAQARLSELKATESAGPSINFTTDGQRIAEVLRRVETVLTGDELTPGEKHLILSKIIKAIRPDDGGYSVELLAPADFPVGVEYISMR